MKHTEQLLGLEHQTGTAMSMREGAVIWSSKVKMHGAGYPVHTSGCLLRIH